MSINSINNDIASMNNSNITSSNNISKASETVSANTNSDNLPEKISGEVINLTRSEITVKGNNGEVINGKISNPELIKIGMIGEFKISADDVLSLISTPRQQMQDSTISDTLFSLGIKNTAENKEIVKLLLNNSYPVTKENFQLLNQALKIVGADKPENALFFLNNGIKPSFKTADNIASYVNQEIKISNQLSELTDSLMNIENTDTLKKAFSALNLSNSNEQLTKELENLPVLKENTLNLIENEIKNLDLASSNINNTELNQATNQENQTQATITNNIQNQANSTNELSTQTEQSDKLKAFIENNVKDILESIKNDIKSGDTDKLIENLKSNPKLMSEFKDISSKELLAKLFDTFPKLEKPLSDLLKTKDNIKKAVEKEFFIDADKNSNENKLSKHLSDISEKLTQLKTALNAEENQNNLQSLKLIDNINNNFKFSSMLQNTVFLQFPVTINNEKTTAELYVFKDKKNKKPKKAGQASALIALDTAYLGHLEAYVQKNNQSITCQFRLQSDEIQKLVSQNISSLNAYLSNYNLSLENVSYKKINEPFTVVDNEPNDFISTIKDFNFDMQT